MLTGKTCSSEIPAALDSSNAQRQDCTPESATVDIEEGGVSTLGPKLAIVTIGGRDSKLNF